MHISPTSQSFKTPSPTVQNRTVIAPVHFSMATAKGVSDLNTGKALAQKALDRINEQLEELLSIAITMAQQVGEKRARIEELNELLSSIERSLNEENKAKEKDQEKITELKKAQKERTEERKRAQDAIKTIQKNARVLQTKVSDLNRDRRHAEAARDTTSLDLWNSWYYRISEKNRPS